MPMLHPVGPDVRHLLHLLVGEGCEEPAVDEIAFDPVFRHALADDPTTLERHLAEPIRLFLPVAFCNRFKITAIAVDDLTAIATRGAEADPIAFENDHGIALFRKLKGCRNAGKAGADDADVGRGWPSGHAAVAAAAPLRSPAYQEGG